MTGKKRNPAKSLQSNKIKKHRTRIGGQKKHSRKTDTSTEGRPSPTPYDDAFRTIIISCPQLVIPFIRNVFPDSCFSNTATVNFAVNEQLSDPENGMQTRRITDSDFNISETLESYCRNLPQSMNLEDFMRLANERCEISQDRLSIHQWFMMECESDAISNRVVIRFSRYAIKSGMDNNSTYDGKNYTVIIPHMVVVSLRGSANTKKPENGSLIIRGESGETRSKLHVIWLSEFDIDTIFEHELYMLIPFIPFLFEKDFEEISSNEERLNDLLNKMESVSRRIRALIPENDETFSLIHYFEAKMLQELLVKVTNALAEKYPKIREGVEKTMGGNIIELDSIKVFQEGRLSGKSEYTREGKREGKHEGKCEVALKMMRKGISGNTIMECTDIGRKEINKLAKDNHLTVSWNDDEAMAN